MSDKPVIRMAVRAVLLTPQSETLLMEIDNPEGHWRGWITPGGGLEEGETEVAALKRELHEELGFELQQDPPRIWTRTHRFPVSDKMIEQHESFFLILTEKFELTSVESLNAGEMLDVKDLRWWSLDELLNSEVNFAPNDFPKLFRDLVEEGVPNEVHPVGR